MKHIVIDDAVPYAKEIFSHLGQVTTLPGREIKHNHLINADALIVRSRTQVNANLLDNTQVKFVGSTVVGLDHIDQDYLQSKQIEFYSAQGCNANSVAEYIINVLFELAESFEFDLTQKTLGIIGVGNVGSRVYEKAKTLNIKCLLNDPPKQNNLTGEEKSWPFCTLEETLQADIITVHTPLTTTGKYPTYHLLNDQRLANIQTNQIIINAARGGIIDEAAWVQTPTLANVIDCWEDEPHINAELYQQAWLATPHIAGHSLDAKVAGSSMVYSALCKYWQTSEESSWQSHLPAAPKAINLIENQSSQRTLKELFKHCHDIFEDDAQIRDKDITKVHKKYEIYRRNYPIYREWKFHTVNSDNTQKTIKPLKKLGFKLKSNT